MDVCNFVIFYFFSAENQKSFQSVCLHYTVYTHRPQAWKRRKCDEVSLTEAGATTPQFNHRHGPADEC